MASVWTVENHTRDCSFHPDNDRLRTGDRIGMEDRNHRCDHSYGGDLFSSFLKRRLKIPPSNRATGLDQIPESLFPALACRSMLSLTMLDITSVLVIFFIGETVLSRLLFKWNVRDRPF
jgi:hypothetical protein